MPSKKGMKRNKRDDEDDVITKYDENDITSSDDELSDSEKKLLEKVRQKRIPTNYDSEDEVYGLNMEDDDDADADDDDDDDDDDEKNSMESDIEHPEDDDLPDERAWGKKKKAYYYTDYVDPDYATSNQKDMAAAEEEEREAINIQKRLAEQLDDADFGFELIQDSTKKETDESEDVVKMDLSKMSLNQKLRFFEKENPEFKPVVTDLKDRLKEIKDIILPFFNFIKDLNIENCPTVNYMQTKYQLTLNYCINVSFYLMLKSKRISVAGHPVIKRLAQYRQLLNQLDEGQGDLLTEVSQLLNAHKNQQPIYKTADNTEIQNSILKRPLVDEDNNINRKKKKKVVISEIVDELSDDLDLDVNKHDDNSDDEAEEDEKEDLSLSEEIPPEEKRPITYEIAKNKGLTPYRKKELRNPRVKHRLKYRKAIIRRKGAVREVRKEINKYSGEMSGIKASVKKGIKLK
ncbi:something about silencing protein 10 [Chelonus insularis]|uniref:something about silencing protein 10 n=1 Tax=Chelonus insularis TaxID=460826 RepID=UPI00158CC733|nr:something about silencing protein 10 [Chelonus insularis]